MNDILKLLGDYGFMYLFIATIMYFVIQFGNQKLVEMKAKSNMYIDSLKEEKNNKEIEESRKKILAIQKYIEDNADRFFSQGVDRVNVWVNHNGTRKGSFHFIFYSLIAEIVAPGLEKFWGFAIKPEKIPYYVFSEYEHKVLENDGSFFTSDIKILGPTAQAVAKDTGAKSMYIRSLCNIKGEIEGLVFCTSVFKPMTERPKLKEHIDNIRALFING